MQKQSVQLNYGIDWFQIDSHFYSAVASVFWQINKEMVAIFFFFG